MAQPPQDSDALLAHRMCERHDDDGDGRQECDGHADRPRDRAARVRAREAFSGVCIIVEAFPFLTEEALRAGAALGAVPLAVDTRVHPSLAVVRLAL